MLDQDLNATPADNAAMAPLAGETIETQRLVLTPLKVEDAVWVGPESGRPEVARNLALVPEPNPALAAEMFILMSRAREAHGLDLARAVRLKSDQTPLGVIGAGHRGDGVWSFGYWYSPSAWGKGYATEAGEGLIGALRARGARRLKAGYFTHNPASRRVLEKLGFEHNGQDDPEYCAAILKRQPHRGMTAAL